MSSKVLADRLLESPQGGRGLNSVVAVVSKVGPSFLNGI